MWINNPLINKSEVARLLKISPTLLYHKIKGFNRNKFAESELVKLDEIKKELKNSL